MIRTQIFVNDDELDLFPNTIIPITAKFFDLNNITERYVGFSQQISLPKTKNNLALLGVVGEEKSTSTIPYENDNAVSRVVLDGIELMTQAFFIVLSTSDTIRIQIFTKDITFFNNLSNDTLQDLPTSGLNDKVWASEASTAIKTTTGLVNPLISYKEDNTISTLNPPSIYYHTLINLIFAYAGYTKSGSILTESKYLKTIVPFSKQKWTDDPEAKRTKEFKAFADGTQVITNLSGDAKIEFPRVVFNGSDGFWDNSTDYDCTQSLTSNDYYIVRPKGRIRATTVDGTCRFKMMVDDVLLGYIGTFGNATSTPVTGETLFDESTLSTIAIQDGTNIKIEVEDDVLTPNVTIEQESFFELEVVSLTPFIIESGVSIFPPVLLKDFIKEFVVRHGLVFKFDNDNVALKTFNEIIADKSNAVDWTNKRDYNTQTKTEYQPEVAQKNVFKYQKSDAKLSEKVGEGEFLVENGLLKEFSNYTSIFTNATDFYNEANGIANQFVSFPFINSDNEFTGTGLRIAMIKDNNVEADLTQYATFFEDDTQPKDLNFNHYLTDHYSNLIESFQKAKIVTRSYNLDINDFYNYDPHVPIYDDGSYFLVNEIKNFIPGEVTKVELLKVV